jgi:hypothetical protein
MPILRAFVLAAVFCLISTSAQAQVSILNETFNELGNTSVKVDAVFAPAAQQGSTPFRITISNRSGKDRTWKVNIGDSASRKLSTDITESILVENGAVVTREIYLPVAPLFAAYTYRSVRVNITSPGLGQLTRSIGHEANDIFPAIGISKALARRSRFELDEHVKNRTPGDARFALPYLPEQLPINWRGYSSLDCLLIDLKSWEGLNDTQTRSLLEWVRMGGRLDIFVPESQKNFAITDLGIDGVRTRVKATQSGQLSLGQVHVKKWDGNQLNISIVDDYTKIEETPRRSSELESYFGSDWTLRSEFGEKKFNPGLILIPLLIFAIVVAPVNLFYFAKKGQRHRLFYTTPIISVAACLIIVVIIFLEDGLGGRGYRATLADIQSQPGEMRLYLTQEQVSRTGVVLQSGFDANAEMVMDPVNLPNSVFNPLSSSSARNIAYHFKGQRYGGGFFRSRSEQGFSIRSSQPTRARIEMEATQTDGAPPSLISSLPVAITSLYFRGVDGKIWVSPEDAVIAPGSPIPLEPSSSAAFENWLKGSTDSFSKALGKRILTLANERERYFAIPKSAGSFPIPSHPSIDWEREVVVLTGMALSTQPSFENE